MKASLDRSQGRRFGLGGEAVAGLTFVLPIALLFAVLRVLPAIWTLYISFTNFSILRPAKLVGLKNYLSLLGDDTFRTAFKNTIVYSVSVTVLSTFLALGIALMLDQKLPGRVFYRTAFYIPIVISSVAIGTVWLYILNPEYGPLNYFLSLFGMSRTNWLESSLAMPSVIGVGVWSNLGYNVVIYLAGLQGIPEYLHEAALVDGANSWRRFRKITWPLLLPTTTLVLVLTNIFAFQAFDQIYVLTGGGPGYDTTTVVLDIYQNAFQFLNMGYAAAMTFVLFVAILILSFIMMRLSRREVQY